MNLPQGVFQNARVLLVDDDERSSLLLKRMLDDHFKVEIVNDSRLAVAAIQERRPDILLLDIFMPHVDGFEVMDQLKKVIPGDEYFPILVLTGDEAPATKLRALTAGAKDFLHKPLDAAEVVARVRNLLETRVLHLELQSHNVFLEERVHERTTQLEAILDRLRATQGQVVKQERLGALGVMASGIAHDFNNSLSAILGYGELLLEKPGRIDYLHKIISAGRDASDTVRRLREFYKPDHSSRPFGAVNLNTLAEQAASLTMPRWSNQALARGIRIGIEMDLADTLPLIAGNPAELRELLTNLIFNAVDALPEGGEIRIRTCEEADGVLMQVRDNGVGMDEQTAERCLEPFFTTKGERGTGLGLSVVHGIVKRHHGTVSIESGRNQGTSICLRFPRTSAVVEEGTTELTPNLERTLQILLVDDQPIICELVAELLRIDGHVVHTAGSAGSALEKFREVDYDLLITDLAMPGMNGEQLANVIKQLAPTRPVILLTGFEDYADGPETRPKSIDLVVAKPASLEDLRRAMLSVMTLAGSELALA